MNGAGGYRSDRHSGSGRGREVKKHGGGSRNWGTEEDENAGQTDAAVLAGEQGFLRCMAAAST